MNAVNNEESWMRRIRVGLWLIIIAAWVGFFLKDLNPSGELTVSYRFCKPSPYVSEFSPHGRVLDIERREDHCTQSMVIDPVYVDVRLPQRYDSAVMILTYQKSAEQSLQAGPWASATEWQWALKPLDVVERSENGWETATAQFDITAAPLDHRRLRFMLSSPGLAESGGEIVLREVRFMFEKPPLGWETIKRWMASFLWK